MWRSKKSTATTLVSRETQIAGDVHFSGTLVIEGIVRGSIVALPDSDALVRVVDGGSVEGEIRAPVVLVNGEVQGDVHAAEHIELAPRARVAGNVFYTLLEMAAGCQVNGRLVHCGSVTEAPQQPVGAGVLSADYGGAALAKVD